MATRSPTDHSRPAGGRVGYDELLATAKTERAELLGARIDVGLAAEFARVFGVAIG